MLYGLSRTLREIHRLSREASAAVFQDAVFKAMQGLIRCEAGFWGGGRPPAVLHYVHLFQLPVEMNAHFEQIKDHPKMVESIALAAANAGKPVPISTNEFGLGFFYGHYGIDQLVTLYQPDEDLGLYHILSLYRHGDERFSEDECKLFGCAVPHLLDAYRENCLLHLSGGDRNASPLVPAAGLIDWERVVHFARPAFIEMMRREWPDWHGPDLPDAIRRAQNGVFTGKEVSVRLMPTNGLTLVTLREKGPLDLLSAREMEVVQELTSGATYKEIANKLGIAPSTARNYIANVHAKLGTNKSSQVAAMLINQGGF